MSKLKDFEELAESIVASEVKPFMKEAMTCYFAGAYRGCIILSYISLFDDLCQKLEAITDVNKKAKKLYLEIEKRKKQQDVYENYLLEQLLSNNLISSLEKDTIDIVRVLRNKSAHPSGHNPSAEEARFIFSVVIDKFLSKPVLNTNSLVDRILSRLGNVNFFTSTYIGDTKDVTEHEICNLHESSYPYLISKLLSEYRESEGERNKNASFLLDGMAALNWGNLNEQLVSRVIIKILDDEEINSKAMSMVSANPNLIKMIFGVDLNRFKSTLMKNIKSMAFNEVSTKLSHPVVVMRKLAQEGHIDEFDEHFEEFVVKVPYRSGLIKIVSENKDTLLIKLLDKIYSDAGSYTFDTANMFISRFQDVEEEFAALINDTQSFILTCKVVSAARHGAFDSEAVCSNGFNKFSNIRAKALNFISESSVDAENLIKEHVSEAVDLEQFNRKYLKLDE